MGDNFTGLFVWVGVWQQPLEMENKIFFRTEDSIPLIETNLAITDLQSQ